MKKLMNGVKAGLAGCCLLFSPLAAAAQGWVYVHEDNGHEHGYGAAELPGGGFLGNLVLEGGGASAVIELSPVGELVNTLVVWPEASIGKILTGPAGEATVLAWKDDSHRLLHLNAQGQVVWQTDLGAPDVYNGLNDLLALPDQGFLASVTLDQNIIRLVRLDSAGTIVWQYDLTHGPGTFIEFRGLSFDGDSTFLLLTRDELWQGDLNGTWSLLYSLAGSPMPVGMIALADGNSLLYSIGLVGPNTYRKISPSGQLVWELEYPFVYLDTDFLPIAATADSGFAILDQHSQNPLGFRIYKFSAAGTLEGDSQATLPGDPDLNGTLFRNALSQTTDGGYIIGTSVVWSSGSSVDAIFIKTDAEGNIYPNYVVGRVASDDDLDCTVSGDDGGLPGWKARLSSTVNDDRLYNQTSPQGAFQLRAPSGNYELEVIVLNPYWEACDSSYALDLDNVADTASYDFAVQAIVECPFLETDIGTPRLRRCFDNTYTVYYCNTGTTEAENAFIRITLDPFMTFVSSALPAIAEPFNAWRFELGTVPTSFCNSFQLVINLDCDSTVLGQTHCVEAHIYPDSLCIPPAGWSGASVEVDGACQDDSVRFVLRNPTLVPTSLLEYIVIEDNIIFLQAPFQIPAMDSLIVAVPANGSTWRLEAEQEPNHPGNSMPSVTVEGCGLDSLGQVSIGFVSQFNEDDGDPFVSIDCRTSVGSFDPNDKQGFPLGYGSEHFIETGQPLEYLIRFQNTGTDTAFKVVVVDTLSGWLDPASVTPGAASHPYTFRLHGPGILEWTFDNILLADSNTNEAGSHGFVKFQVGQRSTVPLGTVIANRAAIYFDFNDPVITNETWHTVGEHFVPVSLRPDPGLPKRQVIIWPNPATAGATLFLQDFTIPNGKMEWYDALGRPVFRKTFSGNQVRMDGWTAPAGFYTFRISEGGRVVGVGKLIIR